MNNLAEQQKTELQYQINNDMPAVKNPAYLVFKRGFDIVCSLFALVVLFIPMLIVALLIKLESPGPAVFKQQRMGRKGKVFYIYKFRTLRTDAPPDMATREFVHLDKYITKIGHFLRKTSIDELPQLINIFWGKMSFIGYRPVCLSEVELNDLRKKYGVFSLRPGLTGLAQVYGRDNVSYKEKAYLDMLYTKKCSIKMDVWCLVKTIKIVITGEGNL